jgi:hypothetical protein
MTASSYGRNFGFRRSDENVLVAEGRFKAPASGTALLIGTAVQVDPASAGHLKACAANAALIPGYAGVLTQEEAHLPSIYDPQMADSFDLGVAKLGKLSVINTGAGVKVWLKNTAAQTRVDGRVIAAVTIVTLTGLAVGSQLGWDGTYWTKVTGAVTEPWFTVTAVASDGVEAVLLK